MTGEEQSNSSGHDGQRSLSADSEGEAEKRQTIGRRNVLRCVGLVGTGILGSCVGLGETAPPPKANAHGWRKKQGETDTSGDETTETDETETSTDDTTQPSMKVGVSDGSKPAAVDNGTRTEQWMDYGLDVQNIFIPWDDGRYELAELFGQTVPDLWQAGRSPMLTWELFLTSGSTPDDILSRVVAGEFDDYIAEWTNRLNDAVAACGLDQPTLYLRLGHEMNSNWYPWAPSGGSGTPTEYVAMWRHVYSQVSDQCHDDVQINWVWAPNGDDVGEYAMEELFPGDDYVDWLAVDCYNWGATESWSTWQSPTEIFSEPVRRLRSISDDPVAITEFGSTSVTESGVDESRKSAWIADAFATFDELGVEMCLWFNEDKETDWAVFGGERGEDRVTIDGNQYEVYPAFKDAVQTYCRN